MKRTHLFLSAALALTLAAASSPVIHWFNRATRPTVTAVTQTPAAAIPAGQVLGLSGKLSHSKALEGGLIYARFDVTAAAQERKADEQRAPVRMMLVLDRSGSMNGAKWEQAQSAALSFVERMGDSDTLGVVAFDDSMMVNGPVTTNSDGKAQLRGFLGGLSPGGGTNISGALESAVRLMPANAESNTRVVLISDGQPTNGITQPTEILRRVGELHEQGFTLTALGVGTDFNGSLMQGIAERGAGFYAFIEDAARLRPVLEQELGQARQTIARQVRFELTVPSGVSVSDIPGRQFTRSGNTLTLTLPDFAPGQTAQVFVALNVDRDASMAKVSASLNYRDVSRGTAVSSETASLVAAVTADKAESEASRDEVVFAAGLRAVGGTQLVAAAAAYESGDRERAFALMDNVRTLFGASADALAGDTAVLENTQAQMRNARRGDAAQTNKLSKDLNSKTMKSFGQNNAY